MISNSKAPTIAVKKNTVNHIFCVFTRKLHRAPLRDLKHVVRLQSCRYLGQISIIGSIIAPYHHLNTWLLYMSAIFSNLCCVK